MAKAAPKAHQQMTPGQDHAKFAKGAAGKTQNPPTPDHKPMHGKGGQPMPKGKC